MANLFHLALHIQNSENIAEKMASFYQKVLTADAGVNHHHAFAKICNTILAFEPQNDVTPQQLTFFGVSNDMLQTIAKNCALFCVEFQHNGTDLKVQDPAGNIIYFEKEKPDSDKPHMGLRIQLPAIDLERTKVFYQQHFAAKSIDTSTGLLVKFFGHELNFVKAKHIEERFILTCEDLSEGKKKHLFSAQHFGIMDLSKNEINQLIRDFDDANNILLTPTLANKNTPYEEVYTFVQDPNGYVVELRYFDPNISLQEIGKLAQQNSNVTKEDYEFRKRSSLRL